MDLYKMAYRKVLVHGIKCIGNRTYKFKVYMKRVSMFFHCLTNQQ